MKLKDASHWLTTDFATNESHFNGLPGGYRDGDFSGSYGEMNKFAYFWSSTEFSDIYVWIIKLRRSESDVERGQYYHKQDGFSIRCLKD